MSYRRGLYKGMALLLTLLCACQPATIQESSKEPEAGQMAVVDHAIQTDREYEGEYPPVGEDPFVQLPAEQSAQAEETPVLSIQEIPQPREVRSVWISYLELADMLGGKTAAQFRSTISDAFENIREYGLNTVVVHVRPFGDAIYRSDYFPWSYLITGTEGVNPGFDPLEIMLEESKKRGLRFEAWINPYRVRAAGNTKALAASNQAAKWLKAGGDHVIEYGGVTSYNPASPQAQQLIVNGVREIVRNYDVDAIHIDDYFYPSTDEAFDRASYSAYRSGGGTLSLADWRRSNVEALIKQIYTGVKAENPRVLFGISPQSSVSNNYSQQYLDVKKIAAGTGYCDYLCPQIYFGFENAVQPYAETLRQWDEMVLADDVQLYVGLAVYKAGLPDSWAGVGSREWQDNNDLLSRMVLEARNKDSYGGFVLYRYDSVFRPESSVSAHIVKENEGLKSLL